MLKVDKKVFERVITRIITSNDIREVLREFSLYRVFFYSLLKDVMMGEDSPNFSILRKIAKDRKVSEQFIIEQAKLVLSHFAPEEPAEDYYRILNVPPTASAGEIRKSWINSMKAYHPDHVGDHGLDITKSLNEAYEILGDPIKRRKYDARRIPALPVVVVNPWSEITPRRLVFLFSLIAVLSASALYLVKSGLSTGSIYRLSQFAGEIEDKAVQDEKELELSEFESDQERRKAKSIGPPKEERAISSILEGKDDTIATREEVGKKEIIQEEEDKERALHSDMGKQSEQTASTEVRQKSSIQAGSDEEKEIDDFTDGEYMVRKGDSLSLIAKRFKVSVEELKEANNLVGDKIHIGTLLLVPRTAEKIKLDEGVAVKQPAKILDEEEGSSGAEDEVKPKEEDKLKTQYSSLGKMYFSYQVKMSLYSFLSDYLTAYKNRDMDKFVSFFEPGARENGIEISKVLPSYRANFYSIEILEYKVRITSVTFEDNTASVDGGFAITFRSKDGRGVKSAIGTISWLLSWLDNGWKIKEIRYQIQG